MADERVSRCKRLVPEPKSAGVTRVLVHSACRTAGFRKDALFEPR